jgi:inosose dehydratase
MNRRNFVVSVGAALTATRLGQERAVKIGYAAITWDGDDLAAIDDISSLGYSGIQLRSNVLTRFGEKPADLRALLAQHGLTFVALSSGSVRVDSPDSAAMIDTHVRNARFLRDAGGLYLQLTVDRPAGRAVVDADYVNAGRLLADIGRRTADLGVPLGFHPHMGSLAERPMELDRVMEAADPSYVRLLLDVAHFQQGGGDSVAAIRRYRDRLSFLHVKDVRDAPGASGYQFVELGQGRVNVRDIFAALAEVSFRGWAVVELDSVTAPTRSAKESAALSKRYLESIGIRI